jgi:hypothetical protein
VRYERHRRQYARADQRFTVKKVRLINIVEVVTERSGHVERMIRRSVGLAGQARSHRPLSTGDAIRWWRVPPQP